MIDIASENLLTLEQAAEKLLVSKRIITKWIRSGSKGVLLEAIKFGTHWRTSEEALQRFGDRQTPNHEPSLAVPTITPNQRQRQNDAAKAALEVILGIRRCESCKKKLNTHKKTIRKNEKLWCPQCLVTLPSATIAQRIRTFRWEASISQDELVAKTGISLQIIRAYEKSEKTPTDVHLMKLIEVFGDDLVSGMESHSKDGTEDSRAST
jgi:excisionase family DNA binding protein